MITHVIQHVAYEGTLLCRCLEFVSFDIHFQVFEQNLLTMAFHFLNYEAYGGKGPLLIK